MNNVNRSLDLHLANQETEAAPVAEEARRCPECAVALTGANIGDDPYCVTCTRRRREGRLATAAKCEGEE